MQENEDTLPRNLLFMIAIIASAIAAYFLNSSLFSILKTIFDIDVSSNFERVLSSSSLWGVASYWSTFALLVFILGFLIPSISNYFGLVSLKSRIGELPRASDKALNVTKDKFLKAMSDFKLVYAEFALPYSDYIVEKQEKDIRKKTTFIGKGKAKKVNPVIVSVLLPASQIFKLDQALNSRLSVWFMRPMPRVLMGIGFLLFIVSVAGALQSETGTLVGNKTFLMGVSSFSLCIGVGVLLTALYRLFVGHLHHRAGEVVKMIENLFDYKQEDIKTEEFNAIETALNKTVSSFKDVSKAINEKQEEAVNALIVKTLEDYVEKIGETSQEQAKTLQKIVDDAAVQSKTVTKDLSSRFDNYAEKIESIQAKLDDHQEKSYEVLTANIEKLVTSLNEEVEKASVAVFDKNSILDDLSKTAEDLSTISRASDNVTDKFDTVGEGLERLIVEIEKMAPMSAEKKEVISAEIEELKVASNKTVGMSRRRASAKKRTNA